MEKGRASQFFVRSYRVFIKKVYHLNEEKIRETIIVLTRYYQLIEQETSYQPSNQPLATDQSGPKYTVPCSHSFFRFSYSSRGTLIGGNFDIRSGSQAVPPFRISLPFSRKAAGALKKLCTWLIVCLSIRVSVCVPICLSFCRCICLSASILVFTLGSLHKQLLACMATGKSFKGREP